MVFILYELILPRCNVIACVVRRDTWPVYKETREVSSTTAAISQRPALHAAEPSPIFPLVIYISYFSFIYWMWIPESRPHFVEAQI
jgi:hypothetical protein